MCVGLLEWDWPKAQRGEGRTKEHGIVRDVGDTRRDVGDVRDVDVGNMRDVRDVTNFGDMAAEKNMNVGNIGEGFV